MVEGEEEDAFWDALGDDEDYVSYLGGRCYFSTLLRAFLRQIFVRSFEIDSPYYFLCIH